MKSLQHWGTFQYKSLSVLQAMNFHLDLLKEVLTVRDYKVIKGSNYNKWISSTDSFIYFMHLLLWRSTTSQYKQWLFNLTFWVIADRYIAIIEDRVVVRLWLQAGRASETIALVSHPVTPVSVTSRMHCNMYYHWCTVQILHKCNCLRFVGFQFAN